MQRSLIHEPTGHILVYFALVAISFSALMVVPFTETDDSGRARFAYWVVSILCFVATVIVGIATRPT
jgi:FtsH-binding integral membrane protein